MSQANSVTTVVALVDELFRQAVAQKASDVHIEPQGEQARVRYRIDGILRERGTIPSQLCIGVISRVKIIAEMDISEKRIPQDGRFQLTFGEQKVDLRVSTMPTVHGEKLVARILDKGNVETFSLERIGLNRDNLRSFRRVLKGGGGLLLLTGPTGSGKTTTLYAAVNEINQGEKNIITVEDPVEYLVKGINQTQVNPKAGLTFAVSLRAILRQDPDVIMVGEIRDKETAEVAVRAAITGHLVLATMHTGNAMGAITRLVDMGIEPYLAASAVRMSTAQRLVRLICPQCRQSYTPAAGSMERYFLEAKADEPLTLYRGVGCAACESLGYRGRMAIHEVLPTSAELRRLILERDGNADDGINITGLSSQSLRQEGVSQALAGFTTIEEVQRTL